MSEQVVLQQARPLQLDITNPESWQGVRKTNETPPRVAVYDVIMKVTGCSLATASKTYSRLVDEGRLPEMQLFCVTFCQPKRGRGQYDRAIPVTDAKGLVQLIWALPGAKDFRQNCADVAVRFLGGDLSLAQEVF